MRPTAPLRLLLLILLCLLHPLSAASLQQLCPAHAGQRVEFRIEGVPVAGNPFDPDQIMVDVFVTTPSGREQRVPAFWYQAHSATLVQGAELVTPQGTPEWRLRYLPTETGEHQLRLCISPRGITGPRAAPLALMVAQATGPLATRGLVRITPDKRGFETADGQALRLIGENVCWPQARGTRDYEEWFSAQAASGQNFARLWMAPWWAGIEHKPGTLNHYGLDDAWRMDRVFELAEEKGLYLMLCLDHHGMYQIANKNWGGTNNFWATNPYSVEQGGPCAAPNDFFAKPEARALYAKRLRYLVARYGASTALHSWQFFNEIDNVIRFLREEDVLSWHREMGRRLRELDPYAHLITTSLTGSSDRPAFWQLPEMDFALYHSYAEASLGAGLARRSADALRRYGKPFLIGEFGVSGSSWSLGQDPYLRGFRQALWGGALGGSAGTSLSWWWEDIHADNAYPLYRSLHQLLQAEGWDKGSWSIVETTPCPPRPDEVSLIDRHEAPFSTRVALQGSRGMKLPNRYALNDPLAAARGAEYLSAYLHGSRYPELRSPHSLTLHTGPKARMILSVKMLGGAAQLVLRLDGREVSRTALGTPAGDSPAYQPFVKDFVMEIPAGRHRVEFLNEGEDWIILDALRFEGVLPSDLETPWAFEPEVFGLRQEGKALLYIVSPEIVHPANALRYNPALQRGRRLSLPGFREGRHKVRIHNPVTTELLATLDAECRGGVLEFTLPDFNEDLFVALRSP
jgi:hypothetical protein